MSERIYAALPEDFIRRMRNWARAFSAKDQAKDVAISSIYTLGVRVDRYASAAIPMLIGDAVDTDEALHSVPVRYRQAVQEFWKFEGRSLREHARLLKPGLSFHTFERWVMVGHEALRGVLAVRSSAHHNLARARTANSA